MAKSRKTFGRADSPHIVALMRLIETQSKPTIANWSVNYAEDQLLPIYERAFPGDERPREALFAAREWLAGNIKLPAAKPFILAAHAAAREAENHPAAQAAARGIGQAASVIHAPTHSLGVAFYAAAAIAYDRVGTGEALDVYEAIAAEVGTAMLSALQAVAVKDEPKPAKIDWRC